MQISNANAIVVSKKKIFDPENIKNSFFLGLILRFSNLNVLHKGLLLQDWVFRLGCGHCWWDLLSYNHFTKSNV